MNYRLATIWAKSSENADFVKTIDLDIVDPISQIVILYKSQSQGYDETITTYAMPVAALTKIELVDGSDVLFSLSGREAQALDFYHNKRETLGETRFMNDGWSHSVVNLNFGRYLYDPEFAFDPKKFTNPQLKISCDISAGACLSDNARLTVLAHVFHDKTVDPHSFLMQKEIKSYDLVDAGHEYTDLPTDFPYRKLLIFARRDGYMVSQQIDRIKLTEDHDRAIILDELTDEILTAILQNTPPYKEYTLSSGSANKGYSWCTPAQRARVEGTPWTNTQAANVDVVTYGATGGRFQFDQGVATNVQFYIMGWCPHGAIEIPFGIQSDPDDWYDVTGKKSVKLDVTGGESTGTCEIVLQQARSYSA